MIEGLEGQVAVLGHVVEGCAHCSIVNINLNNIISVTVIIASIISIISTISTTIIIILAIFAIGIGALYVPGQVGMCIIMYVRWLIGD